MFRVDAWLDEANTTVCPIALLRVRSCIKDLIGSGADSIAEFKLSILDWDIPLGDFCAVLPDWSPTSFLRMNALSLLTSLQSLNTLYLLNTSDY